MDTPTDKLYDQGIPLDAERIIQHADVELDSPVKESIDWEQDIEMDDATRFATMSAVSHYHYVHTSNVLLCDALLSRSELPEPARQAAELLLQRNGEELQLWSKYVESCRKSGTIGDAQKEYFQVIWEQDGAIPTLLGVQHINLAADTSYKLFQSSEPVFQQLTRELREHNRENYPTVNDAFRELIEDKDRSERLTTLRQVAQQVDLLQIIVRQRKNEGIFDVLNTSHVKLAYGTGKEIKQFYSDIGLTKGIMPDIL